MYFDTHSHVQFAAYDSDRDEVVKNSLDAVIWMTNVGTSFATSKSAVELASKFNEGVYASIGLHPGHSWHEENDPDEGSHQREDFDDAAYGSLITDKVMAVGEIGLDY